MSEIEKYEFQGHAIRVASNEPFEVIAVDVVRAVYPHVAKEHRHKYLGKVDPEYRGAKRICTPSGEQEMVTLLEPGLYQFVARSNSPLAKPFQKWLFEEVLPQIRKTGKYALPKEAVEETVEPAEAPKVDPKLIGTVLNSFFGDDEDGLSEKLDTIERAEKLIRRNSKTGKPTYMEQVAIRIATQKALRES
jgi:prophage antirepressor-like protein